MTKFNSRRFFCHVMSLFNFLDCVPLTYIKQQDIYMQERARVQREQNSVKNRGETDSMLFCGGLLWSISRTLGDIQTLQTTQK